ncbi:MAG: transglutaminase domain-containing protein [Cryobacterium sp.]|nr:transglutaminase domain-containing protein [Cryobacterium sp.]
MDEAGVRARFGARLRADWPVAVVLAVTLALAFAGLHTVLEGWGWWWWALALTGVSIGVGLVARAAGLGPVFAPFASFLALAVLVVARFAGHTALLGFIPTGESFDLFRRLVRDSTYSITWQTVPARADESISFVLSLGVVVVLVVAEIVVFSLHAPALVGVPLAALFLVPTIPPEGDWSRPFFIATAASYLALLLLRPSRPGRAASRSGRRRPFSGRAAAAVASIAASAVVAGLVVPAVLPPTDVAVTTNALGPAVATGANPILRLGDDLRRNEPVPVLSYSTVSGEGYYLRLSEISDFAGDSWQPERPELLTERRPVDLPRASGLDRVVPTRPEVGYIHVGNLQSPWLPVPYPARSIVGLAGDWKWVPESFTIASNGSLAAGEDFAVTSVRVEPTPQQLRAAGSSVPEGLEKYLALPALPAVISETARELTGEATSSYERAVALQEALRRAPFRYSEDAPVVEGYDATNVEAIAAFLEARSGYCIHFASAMATMARVLGIPSRIIVGFQEGTRQHGSDAGRTLYEVTTHDLHAWPELYFDGIGWVAFEPTPSRGSLPSYANPVLEGVPAVNQGGPNPPSGPVEVADPFGPRIDDGPNAANWITTVNLTGLFALASIALIAAGLALVPAGVRALIRRRRITAVRAGKGRAGRRPAATAWREVLDTAKDAGVELSPALTPRAVVERLSRVRGMNDTAREALDRIREALELSEFGPPRDASPSGSLADDLESVIARLLAGLESGNRARAHLLAPSLVSRVVLHRRG